MEEHAVEKVIPTYRTIQEYFDAENEVYAMNQTRPLGVISIAFGEKMDKHYTMPKTTKPVCITDRVPKKFIEESQSFRNLVVGHKVQLLSQVEYNKITAVPGVREAVEEEVIKLEKKHVDLGPMTEESVDQVNTTEIEDQPQVNSRILQLTHILNLPKETELEGARPTVTAILEELETMDLTEEDLGYLMSNSKGKIKRWASQTFQDRFGGE